MSSGNLDLSKTLQRAVLQSRKMAVMAQWWTHNEALPQRESRSRLRRLAPWITVVIVLALWQIAAMTDAVPPSLLPAPLDVGDRFIRVVRDGRLWTHFSITLFEVIVGLGLGVGLALSLGYAIAHAPLLEDFLSPLIVGLQSTPVVAYAPLLVIWFGSGATSKIFICALIVFFPLLMNTVVSIRNVPDNLRDLMRVSHANRWQMFIKLEVPAALPVLLTGLKTAATLAVIGAVVGEFIYAQSGIGVMIIVARSQYDTALVYVGVIVLGVMARCMYGLVALLERRLLVWQRYT